MKKVAYCSIELSTTALARRMHDEGAEVLVYTPREKRGKLISVSRNGDGLVPKAQSREQWLAFGTADPNTLWFFDGTGCGELADRLRSMGKRVVGGGSAADKLENDRSFGTAVATRAGMQIPPTREFSTVSAATAFLKGKTRQLVGDGGWAWKSNRWLSADANFCGDPDDLLRHLGHIQTRFGDVIPAVLQERVKGVALSTMQWFNGQAFVGPVEATLEKKSAWAGDLGPSTGCSLNAVWYYSDARPAVAQALHWDEFENELRAIKAPPGAYDINAIVNKDGAWFLEHTPRLGIDSELTSQRAVDNYVELVDSLARGGSVDALFDVDRLYCDVRISVPPYPNDVESDNKKLSAVGVPIAGADGLWQKYFVGAGVMRGKAGLEVSDPGGFVGCCVGAGTSLTQVYDGIYDYLKDKLKIAGLQYRLDAQEVIEKDMDDMHEAGWDAPAMEVSA
jgi:phosphoribosylamine-glycine ligase